MASVTGMPTDRNPVPELALQQLDGFAHHFVDAGGVRLHVVTGGAADAETVVLLAGFPQTWWAWHSVMRTLGQRFRVVAVDLPGQGNSARPAGSYDTHTVAGQVRAALASLGVSRYWLVGHDIGAWVAFSLALGFEDDLLGLALLDAGIPGVTLPESIPTAPQLAWKTWHFAFHLVPELPETLLAGRELDYARWFLATKTLADDTFTEAEIVHYGASLAAPGGLAASLGYYRHAGESARRNHKALARGPIAVPVLGISASHGSIPDMAASLAPWVTRTSGVVVPGSGHFIPDEQPAAVADALVGFCG